MRMGRPIPELVLTTQEQETLLRWAGRLKSAQALAQRARLVLACAAGKSNTAVSREMRLTMRTIGKWRSRFVVHRLEGLLDEPRPGAPRRIGDADVERVLTLTLEATARSSAAAPQDEAAARRNSEWPYRRIMRAYARLLAPPAQETTVES